MKKQLLKLSVAFAGALLIAGTAMSQITPRVGYSLKTTETITVDGNGDEAAWGDAVQYNVDRPFQADTNYITGPDDISGWFKTCWKTSGMYILVWSKDNLSYPGNGTGASYEQDLNEVYIKYIANADYWTDGRTYANHKSAGCANPNNGTYQFAQTRTDTSTRVVGQTCFNAGVELVMNLTGDVASGFECVEELYIPWANIPGDVSGDTTMVFDPTAGDTLGFDVDLTDNDSTTPARKRLVWSNSGVPDEDWNNTTNIGRMLTVTSLPSAVSSVTVDASKLYSPSLVSTGITLDESVASINIYDLSGKSVLSVSNTNNYVNLSNLQKGMYIINLRTTDGLNAFGKMLKE